MKNEPVAWTDKRQLSRPYPHSDAMTMWANAYPEQGIDIPLYTHQYERPHNTVLGPCDKLAEMQAEIERLQRLCESYIRSDYEGTSMFKPFMEELYGKAQEK